MDWPQTALIMPMTFLVDLEWKEEKRRNLSRPPYDSENMQSFNESVLTRNSTPLVFCSESSPVFNLCLPVRKTAGWKRGSKRKTC